MKRFSIVALFCFLSVPFFAQTYTPNDGKSKVKFVIRNFGINTAGTFEGLQGTINFDPGNPTMSSFEVSVDASTVDTDIEARDNHLRRAEYFDVKAFPKIIFKSTRITKTNKENYLYIFVTITIKAVVKDMKFLFKATPMVGFFIYEREFNLNFMDYGVGVRRLSLSDELNVELSVFAK